MQVLRQRFENGHELGISVATLLDLVQLTKSFEEIFRIRLDRSVRCSTQYGECRLYSSGCTVKCTELPALVREGEERRDQLLE